MAGVCTVFFDISLCRRASLDKKSTFFFFQTRKSRFCYKMKSFKMRRSSVFFSLISEGGYFLFKYFFARDSHPLGRSGRGCSFWWRGMVYFVLPFRALTCLGYLEASPKSLLLGEGRFFLPGVGVMLRVLFLV